MPSQKPEPYFEVVKGFLSKLTHFTELDFQIFWECLHYEEFNSHEILIDFGQVENRLGFVMSGITRIYCYNNGKEYTLRFNFPGSFSSSYTSFVRRSRSILAIETLTPVVMLYLTSESIAGLYKKAPGAERIGRSMIELLYISREEKEIAFATQSAEENYKELFCRQPELIKRIPQKHIASYLGITPESLSRIRKKIWTC